MLFSHYLSYGSYPSQIIRPAEILTIMFEIENVCPVVNENSNEGEEQRKFSSYANLQTAETYISCIITIIIHLFHL